MGLRRAGAWRLVAASSAVVIGSGGLFPAGAGARAMTWASPISFPDTIGPLWSVSCPSSTLCVAGTGSGLIASSTPAGPASSWRFVQSLGLSALHGFGVSCPVVGFCVAVGGNVVMTSGDPAGGSASWKVARVRIAHNWSLSGVACSARTRCVAYATRVFSSGGPAPHGGVIMTSTNPAGGAGAWKAATLRDVADSVACASSGVCLLGTRDGDVMSSTSAGIVAGAWRVVHVQGTPGREDDVLSVACATSRYCLAAIGNDYYTSVWQATDPASLRSWTPVNEYPVPSSAPMPLLLSGSCASTGFCAFVGPLQTFNLATHGSKVFTSPGKGSRWSNAPVQGADQAVACASSRFCVVVGSRGSSGQLAVGRG